MEPLEKTISIEALESIAEKWSNIAGTIVDIYVIGSEIVATSTELACYKLAYFMRDSPIQVYANKEQTLWYFVKDHTTKDQIRYVQRLRHSLDVAVNEKIAFTHAEKIDLIKQLETCQAMTDELP